MPIGNIKDAGPHKNTPNSIRLDEKHIDK